MLAQYAVGGWRVAHPTCAAASTRSSRQSTTRSGRFSSEIASITKQVTAEGVTIGTNKAYAAIHQYGGVTVRNDSVTLPARPFLVVQEEDLEEIEKAAEDFIGRVLRE